MSWNKRYDSREAFEQDAPVFATPASDSETLQQMARAREAAGLLVHSDVVADSGRDVTVTMNGHANPDHAPREGWVNDSITVTVTQK